MSEERHDLVIRGGTVLDGTGAPGVRGDVAVDGDRITAVGAVTGRGAVEVDARGLAVCPGFIDVHSHDDFAVLLDPAMPFKVMQGVTTDVVGNCGSGVTPYAAAWARFGRMHGGATPPAEWKGTAGYLARVDEVSPSLNVAVLVGHGTARFGAMGGVARRAPTAAELDRMRDLVREGADAGAVGLSTGLIYEPGKYAATEEVVALARALEGRGLYATHMRNEAERLLEAVAEAIRIGEEAGVPVQISHHKVGGRENWGKVRESLALIEAARAHGLDVTADQYPYTAGSTSLAAVVDNGAFRGGEGGIGRLAAEDVLIASAPRHPEREGRRLSDFCGEWGLDAQGAAERLVREEGEGCFVVVFVMDEADVRTVMAHPTTMIGSDGVPAGSKPHPRLYGCFPRVLGRYVREERVLDLPTAVHRMTGMPAARFGLAGRGVVRPGAFADLVVFDPARVADTATYEEPCAFPAGIHAVYVNGVAVARDGRHTGARPGRALRRGQA